MREAVPAVVGAGIAAGLGLGEVVAAFAVLLRRGLVIDACGQVVPPTLDNLDPVWAMAMSTPMGTREPDRYMVKGANVSAGVLIRAVGRSFSPAPGAAGPVPPAVPANPAVPPGSLP
jgi:hypothetical protein